MPTPPPKTPVVIKHGTFQATIYDVPSFVDYPLANLRKLWKIMFDAAWENEEAIETIKTWLPGAIEETEAAIQEEQAFFRQTAQETETLRRNVAAFGSIATKEQKVDVIKAQRLIKTAKNRVKSAKALHAKAHKLQTIFIELADKARF